MSQTKRNTWFFFKLLLITGIFLFAHKSIAQTSLFEDKFTILPVQSIDFGVFYAMGPGTIAVDYQGNITVTGGVVSLNTNTVTPAIFEIKICQGKTVTINYDYAVMLAGSNGGNLELIIGPTERGESGDEFLVTSPCGMVTQLRVGATLVIPSNSVASVYSGSFPMAFTQE